MKHLVFVTGFSSNRYNAGVMVVPPTDNSANYRLSFAGVPIRIADGSAWLTITLVLVNTGYEGVYAETRTMKTIGSPVPVQLNHPPLDEEFGIVNVFGLASFNTSYGKVVYDGSNVLTQVDRDSAIVFNILRLNRTCTEAAPEIPTLPPSELSKIYKHMHYQTIFDLMHFGYWCIYLVVYAISWCVIQYRRRAEAR